MARNMRVAALTLFLGVTPVPVVAFGTGVAAPGVIVVSGGIGETEQHRLLAHQDDYDLKLVFTLNEGNYIADVNVVVKDGAGRTVVEQVADGPLFLAKLPSGRYSIAATYDGKTVTREVRVADKRLRTEYLRWPSDPEKDFTASLGASR